MTDDERSTTRRGYLKFAGSAAAAAGLAGCTGGSDDSGGGSGSNNSSADASGNTQSGNESGGGAAQAGFPVTITLGQPPTTLDPQNHRETPTDNVVLHAYEGLLTRTRKGKITDALATDYERIEEGRVRFTIRKNVTFHSGATLTPEDVAYSVNRIVDPKVGIASPQRDQLAGVTGAKTVKGKHAVDVLSDGLNPIVFSLFAIYGDIMEKKWTKSHSKNYVAKNMNGTGPFKLKKYNEGVRVVFSRYEDYWREPAAVTELTFEAASESSTRVNQLLAGETDVIVNAPPQSINRIRTAGDTRLAAVPSTRIIYNGMRYDIEPFSSPQFRRAMNYAIDLKGIIENVLSGFGAATGQPTVEGFFGYDSNLDIYPHDPKRAESMVEESGHAGAQLTLHTPVGRYLKDLEIAQSVAGQIDSLSNVSCSVKQRDFGALAGELTSGNIKDMPHFYLIGWGNATFDASQTLIPLLTCDGALSSYCNEKFDTTIQQAQEEANRKKRGKLLKEANTIAHDTAPWIFLNRMYSVYGVSQRVAWKPRRDERIDAYAMEPK